MRPKRPPPNRNARNALMKFHSNLRHDIHCLSLLSNSEGRGVLFDPPGHGGHITPCLCADIQTKRRPQSAQPSESSEPHGPLPSEIASGTQGPPLPAEGTHRGSVLLLGTPRDPHLERDEKYDASDGLRGRRGVGDTSLPRAHNACPSPISPNVQIFQAPGVSLTPRGPKVLNVFHWFQRDLSNFLFGDWRIPVHWKGVIIIRNPKGCNACGVSDAGCLSVVNAVFLKFDHDTRGNRAEPETRGDLQLIQPRNTAFPDFLHYDAT